MNLLKTQAVLARIYTDDAFRQRFFDNPLAVGEEFGLLPEDAQRIAQLSQAQVDFFADSLVRKRLKETQKLLPLTNQILGREFERYFRRFADGETLAGERQHDHDAIAFVSFLEQALPRDGAGRSWIAELALYEAISLQAASPDFRFRVLYSRHPIHSWARKLSRGEAVEKPPRKATLAVWLRLTPRGALRHFVFSIPRRLGPQFEPVGRCGG